MAIPQRTQRYHSHQFLSNISLRAVDLCSSAFGLTHLAAFDVEISFTVPRTPNVYVYNGITAWTPFHRIRSARVVSRSPDMSQWHVVVRYPSNFSRPEVADSGNPSLNGMLSKILKPVNPYDSARVTLLQVGKKCIGTVPEVAVWADCQNSRYFSISNRSENVTPYL